RRAVEVKIIFLHILAVVAFAIDQSEQTFLQNRICAVPKRERETKTLLVVRNSGQSVFAPAVRARARLIVAEVIPRVATGAIVFTHRAPLPLREVRAPFLPGRLRMA